MEQHINITLRLKERDVDIRIPRRIEVRRLIREVDTIFNPGKKRKKYQLRVVNKGLLLDEGKYLSDYPMTTGDLVEIEEI
ncbi:YukD [Streptococcus oralis]|uniref:YukD n=4 Tax=Streptococcus TaxID=1301 RepID=A0A3R9SEE2_STROR|nr:MULTISPECIES: EsaB/YukD family protein [Streptococcus]EGU64011.1 type VII secretion protein, YukD family [Streptococcus mitis bv. 2 str. SK95]ORO80223.1 secretion accessory protein EsaB/YukD [Streptococcus oralis subsp. dentisani]RSI83099.1 YukD [Streptococcus mitis]RSJ08912.1 YukD [Streptococcus mitis]RSJ61701.1 YukD [Streptococcus oralis]